VGCGRDRIEYTPGRARSLRTFAPGYLGYLGKQRADSNEGLALPRVTIRYDRVTHRASFARSLRSSPTSVVPIDVSDRCRELPFPFRACFAVEKCISLRIRYFLPARLDIRVQPTWSVDVERRCGARSASQISRKYLIFTRTDARRIARCDPRRSTLRYVKIPVCTVVMVTVLWILAVCPKGPRCHGRALPKRARVTEW